MIGTELSSSFPEGSADAGVFEKPDEAGQNRRSKWGVKPKKKTKSNQEPRRVPSEDSNGVPSQIREDAKVRSKSVAVPRDEGEFMASASFISEVKDLESLQSLNAALQQLIVSQCTELGRRVDAAVTAEMTRVRVSTEKKETKQEFTPQKVKKSIMRTSSLPRLDETKDISPSTPLVNEKSPAKKPLLHSQQSLLVTQLNTDRQADHQKHKQDLMAMVAHQLEISREKEVQKLLIARDVGNYWMKWKRLSTKGKETVIDTVMGCLIILNAVAIGASMDSDSKFWEGLDFFFSASFIMELFVKVSLLGFRGQFCGEGSCSNIFDCLLIVIDLFQLILRYAIPITANSVKGAPSVSMFRVIRLVRLVRLLKVLRLPIFGDLIAMITGLIGGLTTLAWAIILFILIVYIWALLFREFFGNKTKEHVTDYFDSVPRSMFTVFRCAFGDCNTAGGVPIFEAVHNEYGMLYSGTYCIFVFMTGIGLFNVISAIFVESTMASATASRNRKFHERLRDTDLWESRACILITCFMEYCRKPIDNLDNVALEEQLNTVFHDEIGPGVFNLWVQDERVSQALDDLDIAVEDRAYLFGILDCDNSGNMFVTEIIDGIKRLRGEPRRSDIITVDLMVRVIQSHCSVLVNGMERISEKLS